MNNVKWEYEFDPYGDNIANKVVNERHTITPANGKDFNFFIPRKGPFHRRAFVLRDFKTKLPLKVGTDYYFGWRFTEILLSGAVEPVYGAVVLNDPTRAYDVEIEYQSLGGPYTLDDREIAELLANTTHDPRRALWTDVTDIPAELPPIPHRQSTGTLVGFDAVVEAIYKMGDAITQGNVKAMQALMEHVLDKNNPHHISLGDLGIDSLGNFVVATKEEAEAGTDNVRYMSALRVNQFCTKNIIPLIDAHKADESNPHKTTKSQVGLGLVENYKVATDIEAQAAVATNRYMTPATTRVTVLALADLVVESHASNYNNPHRTTKTHVGLGNVSNYRTATLEEALAGTANDLFVTPYLVAKMIQSGGNQEMSSHILDKDNPHETTKNQVGLGLVENYGAATAQDMRNLVGDPKYVTTTSLKAWFDPAGGASTFITKKVVGLDRVPNYAVATDYDIASHSNQAFATPETVAKMMSGGIQTNPVVTAVPFDPATFREFPFTAFNASEKYGIEESKLGFGVYYNQSSSLESHAYTFADYPFEGANSYTATITHIEEAFNNAIGLFSISSKTSPDKFRFGVCVGKGKMSLCRLDDGVIEVYATSVTIPAVLDDVVTLAVTTNMTSGSFSVVLSNAGATYTISGNLTDFATLASIGSLTDYNKNASYGCMFEIDKTNHATLGTRFSADYLPATEGVYIYTLGTRKKYTFNGRTWSEAVWDVVDSPDGADTRVQFNRFATYWNFATDEMFIAVTSRHLVAIGMNSFVV